MTGVLVLLVGSAVVGLHGHRPLLWLADRRVDPTILLTGWMVSTVGLAAPVLMAFSVLTLPADEHPASGLFALAGGCWTAVASGSSPSGRELVAAISVLSTAGLVGRLAWMIAVRRRRGRGLAPHLQQLRRLAAGLPTGEPLWVRDDRPLAVSIGGRPGVIVMSDTLRHDLTPVALAAALEHERAHLRGRHHRLLAVVELLAAALPGCPLLRAAPSAVKDLVELAADAQAARRWGPAAVQEALCRLTGQPVPMRGLGMGGRLTRLRMARLSDGGVGGSSVGRLAGCAAAAVGALFLPAATGWLAVNVVGCVVT